MEPDPPELDELPEWVKLINKYAHEKGREHKIIELDKLSIESLVFNRIYELYQPVLPDRIIRFPLVFSKICPIYCLTKGQAWTILKRLEQNSLIEIIPYQGIRIKNTQQQK